MGMMINRRRVMGGKKDDTYIQDGLVFWLDGEDFSQNDNLWVDRINQIPLTTKNCVSDGEGGVAFNGNSGAYNTANTIDVSPTEGTVECVFSEVHKQYKVLFSGGVNKVFQGIWGNGTRVYTAPGASIRSSFYTNLVIDENKFHVMSSNDVRLVLDGISYTSGAKDLVSSNPPNNISVGNWWYGYIVGSMIGTIKQVRVYNRLLTEAEQKYNYEVDRKRYNL